jgi:hypothetical protein
METQTLRISVSTATLIERKEQKWTRIEGHRSDGGQIPIFVPGKLLHLQGKTLDAKVKEKEGKQGKYFLVSSYTLVTPSAHPAQAAKPQAGPAPTTTPQKEDGTTPEQTSPRETARVQKFRVLYLSYLKLAHDGLTFIGDKSAMALAANGLMAAIEKIPALSQEGSPKTTSQYIGCYCKEYQEMFSHLSPLFDGDITATAHATNGYMISFDRCFRHHLLSAGTEDKQGTGANP